MQKHSLMKGIVGISFALFATANFAATPEGFWKSIDDRTGEQLSIVEIRKGTDGYYHGKIVYRYSNSHGIKLENCIKCPAPYTNKPILGMDIIKGLKHVDGTNNYEKGRVIDPLSGKLYDAKMKLNATGKRLSLRAYIGVSALGRNQTWLRID